MFFDTTFLMIYLSQDKNPVKASTAKYKVAIVDKDGAKEIITV